MDNLTCPGCGGSDTFTRYGFHRRSNGKVQQYKCQSCGRRFREDDKYNKPPNKYNKRPFDVSGKSCPFCGRNELRSGGFHTRSDGSIIEQHYCKVCKKRFTPNSVRPPTRYADENCPNCGSSNTVKRGSPRKNEGYTSQLCVCKDCGKKFTTGKRESIEVFLNGKVIHSYWKHEGLKLIPDEVCPNCSQKNAVLKTECRPCSLEFRNVRTLICLDCGQKFTGGQSWSPSVRRMMGKTIPPRPWEFSDDIWDVRELFSNFDEDQSKVVFLRFSNCGSDWFKKLFKTYILSRIKTGVGVNYLPCINSVISRFGRFLQQQGVRSMEEIDRKLLAIYWVQERGEVKRSTLNIEKSIIKIFLNWGNAEQHFSTSPTLLTIFDYSKTFYDEADPLEEGASHFCKYKVKAAR